MASLPRHYIFGLLIFTFFIVGGVSIISLFQDVNPDFIDQEKFTTFNDTFNVMPDLVTEVGNIQDGIENADTNFGVFGVLNSLISSAWQSLRLLFQSFSFMTTAYRGLSTLFGVPTWVPTLIGLFVTVLIAFAIFSVIFQRDT